MNLRMPRSGRAARLARAYLASQGVTVSHSQALELVARLHGYASWQAMAADRRFAEAPALKPVSSDEYELTRPRGRSVWIGVENLSVYIKRDDEGVAVDLYARGAEDRDSLAATYALYAEAEDDEAPEAPEGATCR